MNGDDSRNGEQCKKSPWRREDHEVKGFYRSWSRLLNANYRNARLLAGEASFGFPSFAGQQHTWLKNGKYEVSKLGDLKSQIRNPKYKIAGALPQPFGSPPRSDSSDFGSEI
jgi:hypothetical protein